MFSKQSFFNQVICIFCGALSTLTLEPYGYLPFIVFFSFGIFFVFKSDDSLRVFFRGLSFGFGWFFSGLYWIGSAFLIKSWIFQIILPFALVLLPIFLGVLWGCVFYFSSKLSNIIGNKFIWLTILLSLVEFFRGYFLNFPWLMPSSIFSSNIYTLQSFSFVGAYSMNVISMFLVILPLLLKSNRLMFVKIAVFIILPILSLFLLSSSRLTNKVEIKSKNDFLITIVQPNIAQKVKWNRGLLKDHLEKLYQFSRYEIEKITHKKRLIIWPETSFAGVYPRDELLLMDLVNKVFSKDKDLSLFLGLIRNDNGEIYNSGILFNQNQNIQKVYDKNFLVPFGEYNPLRFFLNFLPNLASDVDFKEGRTKPIIAVNSSIDFMALICYEIIFNNYIFKNLSDKTALIINITNDAWFGNSIGPYQHFDFAKIRAVEFGIPVIRVANTGISGFINPYGEVIEKLELNIDGSKTFNLVDKLENTIFKTYGNSIFIFIVFYVFMINITLLKTIDRKQFL